MFSFHQHFMNLCFTALCYVPHVLNRWFVPVKMKFQVLASRILFYREMVSVIKGELFFNVSLYTLFNIYPVKNCKRKCANLSWTYLGDFNSIRIRITWQTTCWLQLSISSWGFLAKTKQWCCSLCFRHCSDYTNTLFLLTKLFLSFGELIFLGRGVTWFHSRY